MRVGVLVTTTYTHDSRVRRAAEFLAELGHEVHVVCCFSSQLPAHDGEKIGPVRVHRVARETRDFLSIALSRLGRRRYGSSPTPSHNGPPRSALSPRVLSRIRSLLVPLIILHRRKQQRRMARVLAGLCPDVVHANDPDTLPAAKAAIQGGATLVYDAHELSWSRNDTSRWERRLDLRAERRFVPRAAAVITVSPGIADILQERYGVTALVIRSVPHTPEDWSPPFDLRDEIGADTEDRIILYQGLRSPGRGLPQLIRAVGLMSQCHLVLLGSEVRGMDQQLQAVAAELQNEDRVHILDPVPSEKLLTMTAQADVGTCLIEDVSLSFKLSLPNKLFEYLAAGVPVVASDLPEIRRVIEDCRGGVVCDPSQPKAIASALQRTVQPPDRERVPTAREELQKLEACYGLLSDQDDA